MNFPHKQSRWMPGQWGPAAEVPSFGRQLSAGAEGPGPVGGGSSGELRPGGERAMLPGRCCRAAPAPSPKEGPRGAGGSSAPLCCSVVFAYLHLPCLCFDFFFFLSGPKLSFFVVVAFVIFFPPPRAKWDGVSWKYICLFPWFKMKGSQFLGKPTLEP